MRGFILSTVGYQVVIPDAVHHGERNPLHNYDIEDARRHFGTLYLEFRGILYYYRKAHFKS